VEWVVREGVGSGGEINQALYAHMNNKRKMKKKKKLMYPMLEGNASISSSFSFYIEGKTHLSPF
jgi:hypothetical protein